MCDSFIEKKVIQKASEHSKQAGCSCITAEHTSELACDFCLEISWSLNNMVKKARIDTRNYHMLPDTVIFLQDVFMKLPAYSYFV